ncbi:MAG: hypothetical protein ACR2MG_20980 [Pyrinomonadaceae bacterium]
MKSSLDNSIAETEVLLKQMREKRREELRAARRLLPKKKTGRKPLDEDILELARKLAERKPLTEVALQLNISLRSLYNKGISRAALNRETR